MDQNEDLKLQTDEKFNKYQFLKRTLQFVFTLSIFSSFVWYSSGFSILPQSFNAYFSTFLFPMFTHTLERKYMFLVFNGILAFLVKSSVFTSPSISAFNIETRLSIPPKTKIPAYDQEEVAPLKSTIGSPESASFIPEEEEEELEQDDHKERVSEAEEQEAGGTLSTESEEREKEASIAEEKGYEGETGSEASIVEEENYEGETGSEVLVRQDDEAYTPMVANEEFDNTDELNRKFEEFIRKMKEEIRIEAQRQLIAV
ncbi:hypothetical protein L6164_036025 [Bauhinia variegata]|uniref:Uncharacterized protein n=1 Tax=Bauhinia variegata TaxID=167791 RepID=A0ACB9KFQ6_BAUVA|nr:hypothetical protein L6164_036025 [Bauhinia variegata]